MSAPHALDRRHTVNCRVFPHRFALLERLPMGGICAEIGIEEGLFSRRILTTARPARLHLVDNRPDYIENARRQFVAEIANNQVMLHLGDSRQIAETFADKYFDWVYIDGDHTYDYVSADLEHARRTVKNDGLIVLNDYIIHTDKGNNTYGVVEAVNQFCHEHSYEMVYLALHPQMFCDVALRKM